MKVLLSTIAAICFAVSSAQAVVVNWTSTLNQAQEVHGPSSVPGATGSATGSVDTVTGNLSWNIIFSGLSGPATGLHFHGPAARGATAGVEVNIGGISGLNSASVGSTTINAGQINDMLAGLWYINVHTAQNGPGEIRGQVDPVPVPAALGLMLGGIGVLALVGRRRRT